MSPQQRDPVENLEFTYRSCLSSPLPSAAASPPFLGFHLLGNFENSRPVHFEECALIWILMFPPELIRGVHLWPEPLKWCQPLAVCGCGSICPTAGSLGEAGLLWSYPLSLWKWGFLSAGVLGLCKCLVPPTFNLFINVVMDFCVLFSELGSVIFIVYFDVQIVPCRPLCFSHSHYSLSAFSLSGTRWAGLTCPVWN